MQINRIKYLRNALTIVLGITTGMFYYQWTLFGAVVFGAVIGLLSWRLVQRTERPKLVWIYSTFLGLFWTASTYSYFFSGKASNYFGIIASVLLYTLFAQAVLTWLIQVNLGKIGSPKQVKWLFWGSFILLILVWGFYLWCLWPGVLTYDSYTQWGEANGYNYLSDWHPLFHTLLLGLFAKIHLSPAPFLMAQIVFGAFTVSYVEAKLAKRGVPVWILSLITLIYAFYPMNGIHMSTVWKDIPYSVALLLFFYVTAEVIRTEGRSLSSWPAATGYAIVSILTALLRKNGLYVVVLVILYLLLFKRTKQVVLSSLAALICIFSFNHVMTSVYHASPSPITEALGVPMQQVAATYSENGEIPAAQRKYFESILPKSEWRQKYNPYIVDPLKFSSKFHGEVINRDPKKFLSNWSVLLEHNPALFVKTYLVQSAFLWKFVTPNNELISLMGNGLQPKYDFIYDDYQTNPQATEPRIRETYHRQHILLLKSGQTVISYQTYRRRLLRANRAVRYDSQFPAGRRFLQRTLNFMQYRVQRYVASGPLALLVIFFALGIALVRFRLLDVIGIFLVPALNFLSLMVAAPAPSFRYVYSWVFSVIPILLYVLITNQRSADNELSD